VEVLSVERFTYRHQGFYFNTSSITLSWNNASGCLQPSFYQLVKIYERVENISDIGNSTDIVLQRNEISINNTNYVYSISIQKSEILNNFTCNVTEAYIQVKPEGKC